MFLKSLAPALAPFAALLLAGGGADVRKACTQAADRGQAARDAHELLAARDAFVACAKRECPGVVRSDCAGWLADVEARTPTVVFAARDGQGNDVTDVVVRVDGAVIPDALAGAAVKIDPGARTFELERQGVVIKKSVVLREGEKNRRIDVQLGAPPPLPSASSDTHARPIVPVVVLGGIGLIGTGLFIGLAASAKSRRDELAATCAPRCDPSDVSAVRTKVVVADVSLGVGIAAFAGAIVTGAVRF